MTTASSPTLQTLAPGTVVITSTTMVPPAPHSSAGQPSAPAGSEGDLQSQLQAIVEQVEATYGGSLGVAVAAPGGVVAAGYTEASPAWSTIKVPIAIAALRRDPFTISAAIPAITVSDNAAAQQLYSTVGPAAVNDILAEAGISTPVNEAMLRPEFSTFGQTALSVTDEAQLAAALPCMASAGPVLELMGQIDPGQAYGLGAIPGARFKGGWGPDVAGAYQVRQFGLIPLNDATHTPAALTALPGDGTYGTGQAMLTYASQLLSELRDSLPAASC